MNRRGFLAGILAVGMAPAGLVVPGPQVILGNTGMIVGDVFTIAGDDQKFVVTSAIDKSIGFDFYGLRWSNEQIDVMRCMTRRPLLINRIRSAAPPKPGTPGFGGGACVKPSMWGTPSIG